jgi:hypothetical protein
MSSKWIAIVLAAAALGLDQPRSLSQASPADFGPLYGGGDGLSSDTAVIIKSRSEVAGIRSEYSWITQHYPGAKRLSQALTAWDKAHKRYDVITIKTPDGHDVVVWFNISAMYD